MDLCGILCILLSRLLLVAVLLLILRLLFSVTSCTEAVYVEQAHLEQRHAAAPGPLCNR